MDEGRKRAMANGVRFGRKRKLSDYQRQEAIIHKFGHSNPHQSSRLVSIS
jgi:hypothetical protein